MKHISLTIPDNKYQFFLELIENLSFVEVEDDKAVDSEKKVLKSIEQGFKEVKMVQEGKLKSRPAKEFLDEL